MPYAIFLTIHSCANVKVFTSLHNQSGLDKVECVISSDQVIYIISLSKHSPVTLINLLSLILFCNNGNKENHEFAFPIYVIL